VLFQEIYGALDFLKTVYETFGFSFKLYLSTRPEKYLGDLKLWEDAEKVSWCCSPVQQTPML